MPGTKGMSRKSAANTVRRNIWRSMRIMRRFTQPDILRTVPGATINNVGKYFHLLALHGFIVKIGPAPSRAPGDFQLYQLARNTGPEHPNRCDRCGAPLTVRICQTAEEKEKEREKETDKEKESPKEVTHDAA